MTYRPKPETVSWEPIDGVGPWRELTEEEFAAVSAEYDARFSEDQKGSLSRWFDHVPDRPAANVSRATPDPKAKPVSGQED